MFIFADLHDDEFLAQVAHVRHFGLIFHKGNINHNNFWSMGMCMCVFLFSFCFAPK